VKFWDSSALLPLFLDQPATPVVRELLRADGGLVLWCLTDVEVRSGLARLVREEAITASVADGILTDLDVLWRGAQVIAAVEAVKPRAFRALRIHSLRAADALQLGAALCLAGEDPRGTEFVTLDRRLAEAARKEGFAVLPA
jgi:predicted nucleic acid-binding protein